MHFTAHYTDNETDDILNNAQDVIFVKDAPHWSALIFTPIWLIIHKMWLFLALYAAIMVATSGADQALSANGKIINLIQITTHIVFFIFSKELRNIYLKKNRFKKIASTVGSNISEAEYRFFDQLIQNKKAAELANQNKIIMPKQQKNNPETDTITNPGA